jgi:hypothetical protein
MEPHPLPASPNYEHPMAKKPNPPSKPTSPPLSLLDLDSLSIEKCTICLGILDQKLSTLECGHIYHSPCINSYFQSIHSPDRKCPRCNKNLKSGSIDLYYEIDLSGVILDIQNMQKKWKNEKKSLIVGLEVENGFLTEKLDI